MRKVMILGSGPNVLGQGAEFDKAGAAALAALRKDGYETIVVNSNPATVMTDTNSADRVYIEPVTTQFVSQIIRQEVPDAILATFGGQTALNLVMELANSGILSELHVKMLGTPLNAVEQTEDRELFYNLLRNLNEPVPQAMVVDDLAKGQEFVQRVGWPVIVRPAYTLGGTGGGIARSEKALTTYVQNGITLSPTGQVAIERSIDGYREIEIEIVRDHHDNTAIVATLENIDPVGIHTGDSMVVTPVQTLSHTELTRLREAAIKIVRALEIEGVCDVQFAVDPATDNYYVIEVNPRMGRSGVLAETATGYPLAKVAALLGVGKDLADISLSSDGRTTAASEPVLDYLVTKLPRWSYQSIGADRRIGTQMKASGEVVAFGRSIEESVLKAMRSLTWDTDDEYWQRVNKFDDDTLVSHLIHPEDDRLFAILVALARGYDVPEVAELTKIHPYFLARMAHIVHIGQQLTDHVGDVAILNEAKRFGFSDMRISELWALPVEQVRALRLEAKIVPHFSNSGTNDGNSFGAPKLFFSTYGEAGQQTPLAKDSVLVIGSGAYQTRQGQEFDYGTVHALNAIHRSGYAAILINCNVQAVSTARNHSDRLYLEPLTVEDILNVVDAEKPVGVLTQFGGSTAARFTKALNQAGVKLFDSPLTELPKQSLKEPLKLRGRIPTDQAHVTEQAEQIGYPLWVSPSKRHFAANAHFITSAEMLRTFLQGAHLADDQVIRLQPYTDGATYEVFSLKDDTDVYIAGIVEHLWAQNANVDHMLSVYPTNHLTPKQRTALAQVAQQDVATMNARGIVQVTYIWQRDHFRRLYAQTIGGGSLPFFAKASGIPLVEYATRIFLGNTLAELNLPQFSETKRRVVYVWAPVYSVAKLTQQANDLNVTTYHTGEVMGKAQTFAKAYYKTLAAGNNPFPSYGNILFTVADSDKAQALALARRFRAIGYQIQATPHTANYFQDHGLPIQRIQNKHAVALSMTPQNNLEGPQAIVYTNDPMDASSIRDTVLIRNVTLVQGIPLLTELDTLGALLNVLESQRFATVPQGSEE
ncbi:carbamoyl phosphate synthase large subunit [Schleiferilactobacillus perolens]|jgi:carbamoyl-phosphate synthase large subunit|uniref:carbamoyl phosphate synthase large subunit n=1 Tax=Schleiferilactobacillus perolens TaxID=100468 RepID=UPI0023578E42|nr:carbamoyl phosphate synthase large subunit [Schleiferilactobacillus perolens]MCI2171905.1 carbamoyl phosphate synthase large subunit [Schleiferilactobacillus perolens]